MKQKSLSFYFAKARKEGWALAQFNFSSAEQLKGIVLAAAKLSSPLLVGTSENDAAFIGMRQAVALVGAWREDTGIPIFLNFDHGKSLESIKKAIEAGYDAVHFDGSHLDFASNVALCKKIVAFARRKSISVVEGEFGEIPGHSTVQKGGITLDAASFTDPKEAGVFVQKTGVDSLAVLVGTVHGVYEKNPNLDLERLQKIAKSVSCNLVLHGGSGTPQKDLFEAIKLGVVKVNISTDTRLAFARAVRGALAKSPEEITPYKIFPQAVEAVQKVTEERIEFFGSENKIV